MSAQPDPVIYEDGEPLFLDADEAMDERGDLFERPVLAEAWHRFRSLTEEEKADPERVYDLFMGSVDTEFDGIPPRVYWEVEPETEEAVRYWRVTEGAVGREPS